MRLIEKKCPNCGAELHFDEKARSCKCEYCKREFEIERDEHEEVTLTMVKAGKTFFSCFLASHIIIMAGGLLIFVICLGIFIFSEFKIFNNSSKKEDDLPTVVDLSKIDYSFVDNEATIKITMESSTVMLNMQGMPKREKIYFLNKKDSNILILVYKSTYKIDENTYTVYTPFVYENIEANSSGNISLNLQSGDIKGETIYLGSDKSKYSYGYSDMEILYNELVKPHEKNYKIIEK